MKKAREQIQLSERLGRIWRWPLYSRARFGGTLTTVVFLVLVVPSPSGGADTSPSTEGAVTPSVTWYSTTDTQPLSTMAINPDQPAPASSVDTGTSVASTGLVANSTTTPVEDTAEAITDPPGEVLAAGPTAAGGIPTPPDLNPAPADYATPGSVAARYLQIWCYAPASSAANTNIAAAAAWMTAAGWDDDKTRAVTEESWASTKAAGITTLCGPVTVDEIPAAPNTDTVHWVALSTDRTYLDPAGRVLTTETLSQTRQIVLGSDGRWLVDVQAAAS